MKVEDCIVAVERRTVGGCLDLAFLFTRQFAVPICRLTLVFAVPGCLLVAGLASVTTDMLIPSILIFSFFHAWFAGALVAAVGPQVFGVRISTRVALRSLLQRFWSFGLLTALARGMQLLTAFCVVIPSVFITAWCGHLPEVMILEKTPMPQVMSRLSWLAAGGGYSRNLGRVLGLLAFWALLSFGLFVLIDFLADVLFHVQIVPGRIASFAPDASQRLQSAAFDDPLVLTTLQIALWLPAPVIRVAWFFCYLDQRIRNECWDLDLQFRVEALRLEEAA